MNASSPALSLHFAPILPLSWIVLVALCGIILLAYGLWQGRKGTWIRGLCYSVFLIALLNPSILKEDRTSTQDVAVIVVDKSMSQTIGKRNQRTEAALKSIATQITKLDSNLDVRVIEAPEDKNLSRETRLFDAVDTALANTPQQRRAGVIFLTDGQIHDIPKTESALTQYGPVHALLSGERNEKDRQIVITNAPAYGLVGQEVTIKYKIEDTANTGHSHAQVTLTGHDGEQKTEFVPIGEEQSVSLHIDHPSQNVFTLDVEAVEGEITLANNKSAILINGVRDRLKVLLVSGKPHGGARTWRDLLTSDPGVDLVHFTILREPQKLDYTPQDEVSLIAFPFEELFEIKLYDFDLIVFDQYRLNNILPEHYFSNIARYVEEGGAFLEASGSDYAHANFSLYRSPLREILPASPTGNIFQKPFKPELTELGGKHPVTRSLVWSNIQNDFGKEPNWGRWLRQIDIQAERGDVLLQGLEKKPLLVLDRVGKGRVAQLASDHVWMWARGYEGGGPHAELLRRVVHWLMKEPELDERALDVKVEKNTITVRKQFIDQKSETIAMTDPNGEQSTIELKDRGDGWMAHKLEAKSLGIYAFEDTLGNRKFAIIGDLNPPELRSVITTEEKMKPLLAGSKGGAIWLEQTPSPKIRFLNNARSYAGNSWIALRRNNDYTVTGVKDIPLLPYWAQFLTLVFITIFMWWFEGQRK